MSLVKQISICGFRGIPSLLPINLEEGDKVKSLILYGGGGTGKSSITDAWEWVTSGKIAHLAREGAEESAYPHISAKDTYVEIQFTDESLGMVRLTWDPKRMRTPKVAGNLDAVRKLIAHPCHVRHADLTRFVLLRKSERYDALASLMGFVPQMEYQKSLRKIESQLKQDLEGQRLIHGESKRRHSEHFQNEEGQSFTDLQLLARRCVANGYTCDADMSRIKEVSVLLKTAVLKDPNAKKMTAIRELKAKVSQTVPPTGVAEKIKSLRQECGSLKASQAENRQKLLLIPLLQAAGDFFAKVPATGTCPLCNQKFQGDLKNHVTSELSTLRLLKSLQDKVQTAKDSLRIALSQSFFSSPLALILEPNQFPALEDCLAAFNTKAGDLKAALVKEKDLLAFDANNITEEDLLTFDLAEDSIKEDYTAFQNSKSALEQASDVLGKTLEDDTKRKKLVEDEAFVSTGITLIEELAASLKKGLRLKTISDRLSVLVERYVQKALEDVTARFARISEK